MALHTAQAQDDAIAQGYSVDRLTSLVISPGKFEAEPAYLLKYWDAMMDGVSDETFYDDDDAPIDVFLLTDDDRRYIGQAERAYALILGETMQGFAHHAVLTLAEYQTWLVTMTGND